MSGESRNQNDKQRNKTLRLFSLITNISLSTAGCIVAGILLGRFLDSLFDTSPLLLIILLLLGIAAAFKNIYDISKTIK